MYIILRWIEGGGCWRPLAATKANDANDGLETFQDREGAFQRIEGILTDPQVQIENVKLAQLIPLTHRVMAKDEAQEAE